MRCASIIAIVVSRGVAFPTQHPHAATNVIMVSSVA